MEARDLHYSLVLEWEPQNSIYVVTVPELHGCVTHGRTYEEAILQAQDAIDSWIGAAQDAGISIPLPHTYELGEVPVHSADPIT